MKPTLLAGVVLGATLLGGGAAIAAPSSAPFISSFEVHDDMHGGALWRNNNPQNNNQRGAGMEHCSTSFLKTANRFMVTCTASYTDITPMIPGYGLSSQEAGVLDPADAGPDGIGVQAQGHRVEGLCISYKLDPAQGLVLTNRAYFTKNNSPDWQNSHKQCNAPVDNGRALATFYGFDPDGNNTHTYGMVLGPDCEILSQQTEIFRNTNDDTAGCEISGAYNDADAIVGKSNVTMTIIGNGNGDDDSWLVKADIKKQEGGTGANTYKLSRNFALDTNPEEERSRAFAVPAAEPDHVVYMYAYGDDQPTWSIKMEYINIADGIPNNQRIEWRQTIADRNGNIRNSTPSIVPIYDGAGKPTGDYIANWVEVDISGRNGNKQKGRTTIKSSAIHAGPTGMTMSEPQSGLFGIADGAHPYLVSGTYGSDNRSVAFMFSGSITDGGSAAVKILGLNAQTNQIDAIRALNWADTTCGGYTSQWYGHNPNTAQGRCYGARGTIIANPGYGVAGGYQPTVRAFLAIAHSHHKDHGGACGQGDPNKGTNNGTCGGKQAGSVVLVPVAADPATDPTDPTDPDDPNPTDPTGGSTSLGGCSTGGANGLGGTALLLGLGLAITTRRRRAR